MDESRPKFPPQSIVDLPGRGRARVYDSGPVPDPSLPPRPCLLLLHGWTSTAALNFARCFSFLAAEYRVVAPDQRGHGHGVRSRAPFRLEDCADDAAALVDQLGLGPVIAVGYSMGGPVAQLLWRRHPTTVDSLVFCATASRLINRDQVSPMVGTLGVGASLALSLLPAGVRQLGMNLATRNWTSNNAAADWATEEWSRHDPAALIQAGLALSRFDSTPWIGEIDVPTAIVVTSQDQVVPPKRQWDLNQAIGGSVAFPVPGDHRICADDPDHFLPALLSACRTAQHTSTTTA